MRTWIKRTLVTGAALSLLAVCVAVGLFLMFEHRIAARMRPPQIERETATADDMVFRTLDGKAERLSDSKGRVVFLNLWGNVVHSVRGRDADCAEAI